MKKIIILAGPHKTGTTSIQDYLYKNDGVYLNDEFYFYPKIDNTGQHSVISLEIQKNNLKPFNELLTFIENSDKNIIISGEELCKLDLPYLERLANFKDRETTFSYTNRNQDQWINSIIFHSILYDVRNISWLDNLGEYSKLILENYALYKKNLESLNTIFIDYDILDKDNFITSFFKYFSSGYSCKENYHSNASTSSNITYRPLIDSLIKIINEKLSVDLSSCISINEVDLRKLDTDILKHYILNSLNE